MAEKIIYELDVITSPAIGKISEFESALSNINAPGITRLNNEFRKLGASLTGLAGVTKILAAQTPFTRRGTNSAIDQGLIPNFDLRTVRLTDFAKDIEQLREFRQRIADFNRATLRSLFGNINAKNLLGWNGYSSVTDKSDVFWFGGLGTAVNDTYERHQAAESARARYRRRKGKRNPWSDFATESYSVVPRGATYGVVPAVQTSLQRLNAIHFGGEAFGASAGEFGWTPHFSTVGKIVSGFRAFTKVVGFVTKVISPITASIEAIKKVTNALHSFGDSVLRANESWRLLRESHAYGTSMTSLSDAWGRVTQLGGDRASASALWNRWSRERSMLAFGGDGGSLMEAARLFGLNIRGSGEYGFATNDELARNIVKTMSTLTRSQQVAMKNVLGLDDYQFWSMSQGLEFFDELTEKSRTFSQDFAKLFDLDDALFPKAHSKASLEFEGAWAELVRSFEELGAAIGVYLLPVLSDLMHFISKIVQLFTWFLNLPRWVFESLERLVNTITGISASTNDAVASTASENEIRVRLNEAGRNIGRGDRAVVINIGDISLNSLGLPENATPEQIKRRTGEVIWNQLGDALTDNRR